MKTRDPDLRLAQCSLEHEEHLERLAAMYKVEALANCVLGLDKFGIWPGACNPTKHHARKGGLIEHTREVVDLCLQTNDYFVAPKRVDPAQLFLAALFHDVGKIWDYQPVPHTNYEKWEAAPHKRNIHHITRSALLWQDSCQDNGMTEPYCDAVLHAILSHHGMREWGSPVAPNSGIAWILHLCDGISARMDDFDKQTKAPGEK